MPEIEILEIGATPCEETCTQVGTDNYMERATKECRTFIHQLRRLFGKEPEGATLFVRACEHDSGTYHEVAVRFDRTNDAASDYAYKIEAECPANWDDAARKELEPAAPAKDEEPERWDGME